jgi:hypothetical protein
VKCKHLNFNCIIKKKVPTYIFESPWSLLLLQVFANFCKSTVVVIVWKSTISYGFAKNIKRHFLWTRSLWSESPMIVQKSYGGLYLREVKGGLISEGVLLWLTSIRHPFPAPLNLYNNLSISVCMSGCYLLPHLWSDLNFKGTYGILGSRRT